MSTAIVSNVGGAGANDYRDAGTTGGSNADVVEDPNGHTLPEPPNQIGEDPGLCEIGMFGGPIPVARFAQDSALITDQGSNEIGAKYDANGGFRTLGAGTDVGAYEHGNLHAIFDGLYADSALWSDGTVPGFGDKAFMNRDVEVDCSNETIDVDAFLVAHGGGSNAAANVFGTNVDGQCGDCTVGYADPDLSYLTSARGLAHFIDSSWEADGLQIGITEYAQPLPGSGQIQSFGAPTAGPSDSGSGSGGEPEPLVTKIAEATGTLTMDGSSASLTVTSFAAIGTAFSSVPAELNTAASGTANGTLEINAPNAVFNVGPPTGGGSTLIGTASATGVGSTADATATVTMVGQSTRLGQLTIAQAGSSTDATASASAQVDVNVTGNIEARFPTIGAASGNGQVGPSTVNLAGDQILITGSALFGRSTSATATVEQVDFSATANLVRISSGNLTLGQVQDGHVGPVHADVTAQTFEVILALTVGSVVGGTASSMRELDDASLVVHGANFSVNNDAFIGTMNLVNGANGAIHSARLEVLNGSFTAGTFTIASFTGPAALPPAGLAELTAAARFENTDVLVFNNVSVAVTNTPGAAPGSFVGGTLELVGSEMEARRSVRVGLNDGAGVIDTFGTIALNPSFLDIGDDLILGDGATLAFGIEGLTRPALGTPGQYGAIDADNATLDGRLVLDFDFAGVALGDMFELIRLDPAGIFSGFFDDTTVMGLPAGLTAEAAIMGTSLFATVIMIPPLPGDFNQDGKVDAADYVVWRNLEGQMVTLPNENPAAMTPGIVDDEDYDFWTANFGATLGSGNVRDASLAVPEPATAVLLACGLLIGGRLLYLRRRIVGTTPAPFTARIPRRRVPQVVDSRATFYSASHNIVANLPACYSEN